ncbi:MAG: hypothetical protein Q7W16_00160 [Coriobacteriia bacterium]|nr:hypothetical protein [Coriobacteriia bacterium]
MKSRTTIQAAIALALVAMLIAPAAAFAVPGRGRLGKPKSSMDATRQARFDMRQQRLQERITKVLENRGRGFDAAAAAILRRIDRVSVIASKVESAGADVTDVRASLDKARALVAEAKAADAAADELFKAVPTATDRRAAFTAAKAQAKIARRLLHEARTTLRKAILDLRAVVNGLEGAQ